MANSVSLWFAELQQGDAEAARQLWDRYFGDLVVAARKRLAAVVRRATDEEDVALSVLKSLCRGAEAGRFRRVTNRNELWWLLLALTKRKITRRAIEETCSRRGGVRVHRESEFPDDALTGMPFDLGSITDDAPGPETVAELEELAEWQLSRLEDETLRQIALWRMEGLEIIEIADVLGVSDRTVARKLELIQMIWSKEPPL